MRLWSQLFAGPGDTAYVGESPGITSGRVVLVRWLIEALGNQGWVQDWVAWGRWPGGPRPQRGTLHPPTEEDRHTRDARDVVWYEPGTPWWFWGAVQRRAIRATFPIITQVHGLAYTDRLPLMVASVAIGCSERDAIICPTAAAKRVVEKQFEAIRRALFGDDHEVRMPTPFVIPYGVPDSRPVPKTKARGDLHIPADKTVLTYVGRFSSTDKCEFESLFEALRRLVARRPDVLLLVAGGAVPWEQRNVEELTRQMGVRESVRLLPNFGDELKPTIYSASDIFVCPAVTPNESFGLSVVEAMRYGLPVCVADWGPFRELVEDTKTGLLVEPVGCPWMIDAVDEAVLDWSAWLARLSGVVAVETDQLFSKLALLVENPTLRRQLGHRAKAVADRRYTLDRVVADIHGLFVECLSGSAAIIERQLPAFAAAFLGYPSRVLQVSDRFVADQNYTALRPMAHAGTRSVLGERAVEDTENLMQRLKQGALRLSREE